jgi:peptide chain release factor 1
MIDITTIKKEYNSLTQKISDLDFLSDRLTRNASRSDASKEKFEALLKRKNCLEKIIAKDKELQEIRKKIEEDKTILKAKDDPGLVSLAEGELFELYSQEENLKRELDNLLKEEGEPKISSVIIEIRAGTGGEEAALFARDLFRMYSRYGQAQGWKQKILDSRLSELGGFKEIILELSDSNVFSKIKYEGGVHRVQRIPETEKAGRIHTSTATVAVLPRPKKAQIKINPQDLKIDFYRASGPGGQYVNRRETAVRITHLPSGIAVTSQTERNQLQNKSNALAILEAKLLEQKEASAKEKLHGKRRSQIGGAKRAEKIRTYNFPQNRLTDHRIKKSWKNLEEIFEGNLEPVIENLSPNL